MSLFIWNFFHSLPLPQDGLVLSHWRRVADEGQPYPYARFNKSVEVPTYTKEEYEVRIVRKKERERERERERG